jgi:hypothetical protein
MAMAIFRQSSYTLKKLDARYTGHYDILTVHVPPRKLRRLPLLPSTTVTAGLVVATKITIAAVIVALASTIVKAVCYI